MLIATAKNAEFDTPERTSGKVAGSNIVPYLPYDDLRQWLDEPASSARSGR
jgi:hypothetical protein